MDESVKELAVKEGEWISSKKVVNHKTRQVETRIKRQLIMEDGKVIADSGPQVTIRTKEDNWTEESENSAKKGLPMDVKSIDSVVKPSPTTKPTTVSPSVKVMVSGDGDKVISEKVETKNTTREAKHERFQYHDESISELTGFEIHQKALVSPNDLITINCDLIGVEKDENSDHTFNGETDLPPKGKLTHYSSKSHKVTDKEEIKEISKLGPDGDITKETVRTSHHEEISDDEKPEDEEEDNIEDGQGENLKKENDQIPEISKESPPARKTTTYTKNSQNPVTSLPSKAKCIHHLTHHRHLDNHHHPIYDIAGKADHTNKWIESHFGSSDSSQHDVNNRESGLNCSSSNGSSLIVDRRGRPRQRTNNQDMSQSYDEAYYSNTNGGNQSQSNNSTSSAKLTSTDKHIDCSISSPSPVPLPIGKRYYQKKHHQHNHHHHQQQLNNKPNNTIGFTMKLNETVGTKPTIGSGYLINNNSASESSVSSYIHDYHHSSEGSLSPSTLTNNYHHQQLQKQSSPSSFAKHHQRNNHSRNGHSPITGQRYSSNQLLNSKPINSTINLNHHNSNSRNLIIKVKHRVPKEDASVQASLSDEEADCDHCKGTTTNYGKQSIDLVNNGSKDLNNNNVNHPRPMKTYYFGEPVQSDYPVTNQELNSIVNHDSTGYRLSSRFPVNNLLRSKLINTINHDDDNNGGHLIEQFNFPVNHDDQNFSRSLNCLNDQRLIGGSLYKPIDPASRTDLFQTRDYGSLTNWRSTINLRSNGLTSIGGPLTGQRSKDDSYTQDYNNNYIQCKPYYRDSLNRVTLREGHHLGSVNNLTDNQYKLDQIPGQKSSRGLSPIQERKSSLALDNNLNLLLSKRSTYWTEFNPIKSSTPINYQLNNYNPKGTYKVNYKHRPAINLTYFKAH